MDYLVTSSVQFVLVSLNPVTYADSFLDIGSSKSCISLFLSGFSSDVFLVIAAAALLEYFDPKI